jgi:hypothetical protein
MTLTLQPAISYKAAIPCTSDMAAPKVLIPMADYGHDPTGECPHKRRPTKPIGDTETSVPYEAFKRAGFDVHFATENGKAPQCDQKMLKGLTQKLLVRLPSPSALVFPCCSLADPPPPFTGRNVKGSSPLQIHVRISRIPLPPSLVISILLSCAL